jgi:hypothetical protein
MSDDHHVQYCEGENDITGSPTAERDADEARVWTETADLIVAVRRVGRGWEITGGDGNWLRFEGQEFDSPEAAAEAMQS